MEISDLPAVNATLNLVSLVFLLVGYHAIRHDNVVRHRRCMVTAFCVSVLFLGSYLTYRFLGQEKRFGGAGLIRPVYFFILVTHVTLAATVPFLAGLTLWRAIRGQFVRHRRIARWTFPIWIYVSITGVMVYVMLFVIWRPAGPVEH
ncbi:MAG: DUF420 domain-containing protein [Planctomycetes bacterium]|nr:DUF420 domain-containing protein [Planctomycetota bacterium]